MKMRSRTQAAWLIALLVLIAIPLSSLLVSQDASSTLSSGVTETEVVDIESAESSAVSALVSATAVGPSRGALLNLRHPASAFVP